MNRAERLKDELNLILNWLFIMPLIHPGQLVLATGFTRNRVNTLLARLQDDGLAVHVPLTGFGRRQERWFLTSDGALQYCRAADRPMEKSATEPTIASLIPAAGMVGHIYDVILELFGHPGIPTHGSLQETPRLNEGPLLFSKETRPVNFVWVDLASLDAVVYFEPSLWFRVLGVGPETTNHALRRRAHAVQENPAGRPSPGKGRIESPAGWVIICADRLAAAQAADLWQDDSALVVTVDGHIEQSMRPRACGWRVRSPGEQFELGRPENAARWAKSETPVAALEHELAASLFGYVAQHRAVNRAQLRKKFTSRYAGAVRELLEHRVIAEFDDGFYLTNKGIRAWAAMASADFDTVNRRLEAFTRRNGVHRRQQQRHDQTLVDIVQRFEDQGISAYMGYRHFLHLPGVTQVDPDFLVCLPRQNGRTLVIFGELEFTAKEPERMGSKLKPYRLSDENRHHGDDQTPSVWIFEDERTRQRYDAADRNLLMLTAVLDQFLTRPSRGDDSPWYFDGKREPIDGLVRLMDYYLRK